MVTDNLFTVTIVTETRGDREKFRGARDGKMKILKPVLALTLTCIVWGLILGYVHRITESKIAEAERKEREKMIAEIFPGCSFEEENGIFYCFQDNRLVGKAVEVETKGYGGTMRVLVGINADNTVKGVRVLSHNETRGIGSRATEPSFLSQFENLGKEQLAFKPQGQVEAITGATISSRAILEAVKRALEYG
jgi:electron transport complex protein RnfG